jgi:hypothetical protein
LVHPNTAGSERSFSTIGERIGLLAPEAGLHLAVSHVARSFEAKGLEGESAVGAHVAAFLDDAKIKKEPMQPTQPMEHLLSRPSHAKTLAQERDTIRED